MPKAKPVYATDNELRATQDELHEKIDALKPVLATKIEAKEIAKKADDDLQELTNVVTQNAEAAAEAADRVATDSKAYTDGRIEEVLEEVKPMISELRTDTTLVTDALSDAIKEADMSLRKAFADELTSLCESVDLQFNQLKEELTGLIERRASQAAENLARERRELDAAIDALRREAAEDSSRVRAEVAAEFARTRDEQAAADASKDTATKEACDALSARCDAIVATAEENRQTAEQDTLHARAEAAANLKGYAEVTDAHLAANDEEDRRLADDFNRFKGVPTRRVDWKIKNASSMLIPPQPGSGKAYNSRFSPTFHAAGGEDFQLELRVFPLPDDPPAIDADCGGGGSAPPSPPSAPGAVGVGDCAVYLWASAGVQAAVRLIVGERSAMIEKDYEERTAYGTRRLGFLEDHIEDDTLGVAVEFLETIRQIVAPAQPPGAKCYGERGCVPTLGSLLYQRHLNHRTLPLIRKEIERLQARLVRRVEWQVEQASALQGMFAPVEPICSPIFAAGGVEGMQLLFYPSGYSGATEGFCSLFLYCPAGVTMKFKISAGNQIRDAFNTFDVAGAYGRTNFCRFEILPDPQEDTILLALEIEDVTQDVHALVGSDQTQARSKASAAGERNSPVETAVRLRRLPARESLVDTKPLPSMWTAKALGDLAAPPDGFHTFSDLGSRRGKGARGATTTSSAASPPSSPSRGGARSPSAASPPSSPSRGNAGGGAGGVGGGGAGCGPVVPFAAQAVRRSESTPALLQSPRRSERVELFGSKLVITPGSAGPPRCVSPLVTGRPLPPVLEGLPSLKGPPLGAGRGGRAARRGGHRQLASLTHY